MPIYVGPSHIFLNIIFLTIILNIYLAFMIFYPPDETMFSQIHTNNYHGYLIISDVISILTMILDATLILSLQLRCCI